MLVTFFEEFFFSTGSTIDKLVFVLNRQIFSFDTFFSSTIYENLFFRSIIIVLTYFWLIFAQNLLFQKKTWKSQKQLNSFKLDVTLYFLIECNSQKNRVVSHQKCDI